jgi:fructokinase
VEWLYGKPADAGAVARKWLDLGAGLVVITMGADGAIGWVAGRPAVSRPALPVAVIDTVGAGDAFTSGLLDALARRDLLAPASLVALNNAALLADVVSEASRVAGITCSRLGANPPNRAEVDSWTAV